MAWVALDRAIRSVEHLGVSGPVDRWRHLRAHVHEEVCREGYDDSIGTFVQSHGSKKLDASLLLIPLVGFLPATDGRVRSTIAAIERQLMPEGLVLRTARPEGCREGAFLACNFWLVDDFILLGRRADAVALFERLLSLRNDVGLLAEEYDTRKCRFAGNFPQTFSHVALVNTIHNLTKSDAPADQRSHL
jgi:GH15 family glucan-1,4-alpha-glucosidase